MRLTARIAAVIFLTLATQIGGLAYLLALVIAKAARLRRVSAWFVTLVAFLACYAGLSVAATLVAPQFGRVPLPCSRSEKTVLAVQSPLYCLLNRHYVRPELRNVAAMLADHMERRFPGTVTLALDASYPFFDGFPLLPHLSHDDGRKLDLAFYYRDAVGRYLPGQTDSPIGYWAFEKPESGRPLPCSGWNGPVTLRWGMAWFAPLRRGYSLDQKRTAAALQWLATTGRRSGVSKILIEPHLTETLSVKADIIRFQGCSAARHDDHIHIQVGP